MKVSLKFDTKDAIRGLKRIRERTPAAAARVVRTSAATAISDLTESTARDMKLAAATVQADLSLQSAGDGKVDVVANTARVPMMRFGARGPYPSRGQGGGVTANLPGGRYPQAFLARGRDGHLAVFKRRGRGRAPIVALKGPSVAHVAGKYVDGVATTAADQMAESMVQEFTTIVG